MMIQIADVMFRKEDITSIKIEKAYEEYKIWFNNEYHNIVIDVKTVEELKKILDKIDIIFNTIKVKEYVL